MTDAFAGRQVVGAAAIAAVQGALRARHPVVIAIDGPSGAGKSTLADLICADWRARPALVRLDELYRGWRGLDAGARELARSVVPAVAAGRVGRARSWDWERSRLRAGAPRVLRPGRPIVVEGCGAFAATATAPDALRIWVESPLERRRSRALTRDEGRFDAFWDLWESEWRRRLGRQGGVAALMARAHIVIRR